MKKILVILLVVVAGVLATSLGLRQYRRPEINGFMVPVDRAGIADLRFPAEEDTFGGSWRAFSSDGIPLDLAIRLTYGPVDRKSPAIRRDRVGPILKKRVREVLSRYPAAALNEDEVRNQLLGAVKSDFDALRAPNLNLEILKLGPLAGSQDAVITAHAASIHRRVLVLGIDSGDWTIINRLRAAGKLPTFDRLVKEGATGPLRSIEPLLSPLIWTSIATGVGPERHGILDFLVKDPATGKMTPAQSRFRRAPAVWNIASAYGKKTGVVGWLATWPAEAVNGFVITDRFGFLAFAGQAAADETQDLYFPPDLMDRRARLVVSSRSLDAARIRGFLDVAPKDIEASRRPGYEKGNVVNNFIHTLATAETWHGLGLDLWKTERPDIELVYFEFMDATSHLFMPFAPPKRPDVSAGDVAKYGRAVDAAYERQDEILADYLKSAGDSTVVMILSDHGFRSGDSRLSGGATMEDALAAQWHLPDGVLLLHGPGVKPGYRITGAKVLDIAPTLLALLGCPSASEMPGRVLADAFQPGTFSSADTVRVAAPKSVGFTPVAGAVSMPAPSPNPGSQATTATDGQGATEHINLGIVYAKSGQTLQAESEFKKALEMDPSNVQAANNLASVYSQENRHEDAIRVLQDLVKKDPSYAMGWSNLGVSQQRLGRTDEALQSYNRALTLEPSDQRSLMNRGFLLLDLKKPAEAENDFRKALGIANRMAGARFGLGMALLAQNRRDLGVAELKECLAIDPNYAQARNVLQQLGE